MGQTDETKFPLRVDDDVDAFKKYTERRFTRAIQKKNTMMRASHVSFFFRNTY